MFTYTYTCTNTYACVHFCMCVCENMSVHSPVCASASNRAYLYPCTCLLPGLYRRIQWVQSGSAVDGAQLLPDWRHHPLAALPAVDAQSRCGVRCGQGLQDARGEGEEEGAGPPAKGGAPAAGEGHVHIHVHIRIHTCTCVHVHVQVARKLREKDIRCVQVLARGDPTLELVQIIDKHKCDLTVIGACAHTNEGAATAMAAFFGSIRDLFLRNLIGCHSPEDPSAPRPAHVGRYPLRLLCVRLCMCVCGGGVCSVLACACAYLCVDACRRYHTPRTLACPPAA